MGNIAPTSAKKTEQIQLWALLGGLGSLAEKHLVDVGHYATVRDGDTVQELAELLVAHDGDEQVPWDDAVLLSFLEIGRASCRERV